MNNVIKTISLKKYYGEKQKVVKAVDNINIEIKKGEFVAIVGKSGSGKSTLLHMLGALDQPTSGKVYLDGVDIASLPKSKLAVIRRQKIGFVFQSYNLIPNLTVWENIVLPIGLDNKLVNETYITEVIELLGIANKRNNKPNTLSGGEQQRVAIARALASKPAVILADEPTGNLDSKTEKEVLCLLKQSIASFGQTLVMITHDDGIAKSADRVISLQDGKVISQ